MTREDIKMHLISQISIKEMWSKFDINWENVNPDVNILIGPNGSGKSTLLRTINNLLSYNIVKTQWPMKDALITFFNGDKIDFHNTKKGSARYYHNLEFDYINTFDIPTAKKSDQSQLLQMLDAIVYQNKISNSFFDYRMRIVNFPEQREEVEKRITDFFTLIDSFFITTNKHIVINPLTNKLVFQFNDNQSEINLDDLSSGEKQILLILFKVFLKEQKPFVLLMDEPEISLHIKWQGKLIEAIRQLNPNCQIILATHSPSIFAKGWSDKIVFMEDIVKPISMT